METIKQLLSPIFGAIKEYEDDGNYINIKTDNGTYHYPTTIRIDGKDVDTETYLINRGQKMQSDMTKATNSQKLADLRIEFRTKVCHYLMQHGDKHDKAYTSFVNELIRKFNDRLICPLKYEPLISQAHEMYNQSSVTNHEIQSRTQPPRKGGWFFIFT